MRQRAAVAAAAPPRSADSDQLQWQTRHRSSYQGALLEEPVLDRPVSMREPYGPGGADSPPAQESHARRRRTAAQPLSIMSSSHERSSLHSPQHYLSEYNKNYGVAVDSHSPGVSDGSASLSTATSLNLNYSHRSSVIPSDTVAHVYYAQYANHTHRAPSHPPRANSLPRIGGRLNAHKASFQHFEATFHLDPNPVAAVHFRRALHVPDKHYREFAHGPRRDDKPPFVNPICCANTCAGFSVVGFLFLFFIAILLDTQPLFIGGTLRSAVKENDRGRATTIYFMTAERLPVASTAYRASYAYLATALACFIYVYYERLDNMVRRRAYQDLPDAIAAVNLTHINSPAAGGSTVGVVDGDYEDDRSTQTLPSPLGNWNRVWASEGAVQMREWAAAAAARVWNGRAPDLHHHRRNKKRSKASAKTV